MKIKNGFTPEQAEALAHFEAATESHDLHAYGSGRKFRAHADVAHWFKELERLGIADALTPSEVAKANQSLAYVIS